MKDIYTKSVEEFDEKFPQLCEIIEHDEPLDNVTSDVRNFLKHHTLALIDAEMKRLEGEIDPNWKVMLETGSEFMTPRATRAIGKNQALTDHLTYLKEQREIIDKV